MRKALLNLAVSLVAASSLALHAQDPVAVRGLGQSQLYPKIVFHPGDIWGGTIYLTLDGQELLEGMESGQDGTDYWHAPSGNMGQGKGGSMTFAFNLQPDGTYADTFTTYVTNATFPIQPGHLGMGTYQGFHKVVSGTGRFQNATGTLLITGTYVWFPAAGGTQDAGYFNMDVSGVLSNVAPRP